MHKSYKKTVAILVTCALIGALLCLPVSAIEVGGATINIVGGSFFVPGSDISNESVRFLNATEGSSYDAVMSLVNPLHFDALWECAATFSFSSTNNNGFLSVQVISDGTVSRNSYTDIYAVMADGSTERLNAYITYGNNSIDFEYEGVVPSRFKVVSYSNYLASDSTLREEYYNIIFEPGISLDTQEIIDNQDKNASDIQSNQDKNAQNIIDNQNELAEQEKQEITDSGNQATDAADSIPNESEGFINALGTFVSTMSTTDTDCSITFPAIKIPSFAGIPGATLSEEYEVDFEAAINLIPSDIMRLIQALTTIALIVFCFKELYDTISEALTRKKANSDG